MEYLDKPKGMKSFKEYLKNIKSSPFYYFVKNSNEFNELKNKYDKENKIDDEKDTKESILKYMQYASARN